MPKTEISLQHAGELLNELMKGSIPVLGFFVSESRATASIYGFVDSISAEAGIVIARSQGMPSMSSMLSVPIGNPAGLTCKFYVENAPDEHLEMKYGDTVLIVRLNSGGTLSIFFTAKPSPK